jgi:hypothetical protein
LNVRSGAVCLRGYKREAESPRFHHREMFFPRVLHKNNI